MAPEPVQRAAQREVRRPVAGLQTRRPQLERLLATGYRHLRHYTEIAPHGAWNWCWHGKAAQALGLLGEAREAYLRAIALEPADARETDARELLRSLDR